MIQDSFESQITEWQEFIQKGGKTEEDNLSMLEKEFMEDVIQNKNFKE
jgi:hypothetical protein